MVRESFWINKKIGDVAELRKGVFDPKINESKVYVGLEHIEQNSGKLLGVGRSEDTTSVKACFEPGDILFGKLRPYLRKFWLADISGVCVTEILPIMAKECINNKFLFYLLQQNNFIDYLDQKSYGTKMPRTSWKEISEYSIQLPPANEQQKIAEILSSVDEAIEKTEMIIKQTETVKKGLMQQLLTKGIGHTEFKETEIGKIPMDWAIQCVAELTLEHKQGYYTKEKYVVNKTGTRLIRITDLKNPTILYDDMPHLNIDDHTYQQFKVEQNDFLFARSGASIGRYGIVEENDPKAIFASYLIRFRFNPKLILNRYFGYFYESEAC